MNKILFISFMMSLTFLSACTKTGFVEVAAGNPPTSENKARTGLSEQYPNSPRDEAFADNDNARKLVSELKGRFKAHLLDLQKTVNASGAKLVLVNLTAEYGSKTYVETEKFIADISRENGIEYVNASEKFKGLAPETFTQMPKDGHLSKKGAEIVSGVLEGVLLKHKDHRSNVGQTNKPALFGDEKPKRDEILDGGKDLPYRLKTNAQGLRMDFDIPDEKTKQRVLVMGDSQMNCPFLDNQFTVTGLLQAKFSEIEIANAAIVGYSLDDQISLFNERAKFMEPDIVIVQTNGGDVLDQYFSHRNKYSRVDKAYEPSETEKEFYPAITSR